MRIGQDGSGCELDVTEAIRGYRAVGGKAIWSYRRSQKAVTRISRISRIDTKLHGVPKPDIGLWMRLAAREGGMVPGGGGPWGIFSRPVVLLPVNIGDY